MVELDILVLLGLLGGLAVGAIALYMRAKEIIKGLRGHIHELGVFFDVLDDALFDDKISEEEFRRLWDQYHNIIHPPAPA